MFERRLKAIDKEGPSKIGRAYRKKQRPMGESGLYLLVTATPDELAKSDVNQHAMTEAAE